jgi:hypothetical protein
MQVKNMMNGTEISSSIGFSSIEITTLATLVGIAVAIGGLTVAVIPLIWKWRDRRPRVHICKFPEPNTNPQIWKIRINYWNKPIENCNVLFDGRSLLWDKTGTEYYTFEGLGYRGNLTIPTEILKEDANVVVKSNDKTLSNETFSKIKPCDG